MKKIIVIIVTTLLLLGGAIGMSYVQDQVQDARIRGIVREMLKGKSRTSVNEPGLEGRE